MRMAMVERTSDKRPMHEGRLISDKGCNADEFAEKILRAGVAMALKPNTNGVSIKVEEWRA